MVQHSKPWRVNSEYAHGFGRVVVLSVKGDSQGETRLTDTISPNSPDQESQHKKILSPFPSLPPLQWQLWLLRQRGLGWVSVGHAVRWTHCRVGILACQGLPSLCNTRLPLSYFSGAEKPMSGMGYGISGMPGWASCVLQHWCAFVWKGSLSHQAAVTRYFWSPPVSKSKPSSFQGQLGISADLSPALQAAEQATALVI